MFKKITAVVLGVCVTSMSLAGVSAADFGDGKTETTVEESTFTDGSEGIETESITAMVNDMAAQREKRLWILLCSLKEIRMFTVAPVLPKVLTVPDL